MPRSRLREMEGLRGEIYAVSVAKELDRLTAREVSPATAYMVLRRLEGRRLIVSDLGTLPPTTMRAAEGGATFRPDAADVGGLASTPARRWFGPDDGGCAVGNAATSSGETVHMTGPRFAMEYTCTTHRMPHHRSHSIAKDHFWAA